MENHRDMPYILCIHMYIYACNFIQSCTSRGGTDYSCKLWSKSHGHTLGQIGLMGHFPYHGQGHGPLFYCYGMSLLSSFVLCTVRCPLNVARTDRWTDGQSDSEGLIKVLCYLPYHIVVYLGIVSLCVEVLLDITTKFTIRNYSYLV